MFLNIYFESNMLLNYIWGKEPTTKWVKNGTYNHIFVSAGLFMKLKFKSSQLDRSSARTGVFHCAWLLK